MIKMTSVRGRTLANCRPGPGEISSERTDKDLVLVGMRCQYYVPHRSIKLQQQVHALPASNSCQCNFECAISAPKLASKPGHATARMQDILLTRAQGFVIVLDEQLPLHARCRYQNKAEQRSPNIPSTSKEQKQVLLWSQVLHSTRECPCNLWHPSELHLQIRKGGILTLWAQWVRKQTSRRTSTSPQSILTTVETFVNANVCSWSKVQIVSGTTCTNRQ